MVQTRATRMLVDHRPNPISVPLLAQMPVRRWAEGGHFPASFVSPLRGGGSGAGQRRRSFPHPQAFLVKSDAVCDICAPVPPHPTVSTKLTESTDFKLANNQFFLPLGNLDI
jgi:hypothetical protein